MKKEEIVKGEAEIKVRDEQIEKIKSELEQTILDVKQAQNQLVMKDEQLIHVQNTMLKVGITLFVIYMASSQYTYSRALFHDF